MSDLIRFVVPAAGCANRFGGLPKELLPISRYDCGLTYAVRLARKLGHCEPVVVTTKEKHHWHREAIRYAGVEAVFVVKDDPAAGDMWGSVVLGIDDSVAGGLILPDSISQVEYKPTSNAAISFGCFQTSTPWRFSVFDICDSHQPRILTKPSIARPMLAWGIVIWDRATAVTLKAHRGPCDAAFEEVMEERGYGQFMLGSYADIGSFEFYREFLHESRNYHHLAQDVQILVGGVPPKRRID